MFKKILMAALLLVFIGSMGAAVFSQIQYRRNAAVYETAADSYTESRTEGPAAAQSAPASAPAAVPEAEAAAGGEEKLLAPISVDFRALQEINPDVVGWIYCEDTVVNYPLLMGETDDDYIHTTYTGEESSAGSIFIESQNLRDFQDANTIIYGHHMRDGSMFALLKRYADQSYYEAHPVWWILTPEQDYRVDLFSAYTTSAYSDTYTIYPAQGPDFDAYLEKAARQSDFESAVEWDPYGRYVLLSTCAYDFDQARYVVHGLLTPADSAGGAEKRS